MNRRARRQAYISEADTKRLCKAAPGRVVKITLPTGAVIEILPEGMRPETPVADDEDIRL